MATIRFNEDDRDEQGYIKVPAPRSLAELLPAPVTPTPATPPARPMSKAEIASLIVVAFIAAGALLYSWAHSGDAPRVAPQTPAATAQRSGDRTPKPSPIPAVVTGRLLVAFAAPDGQPLGAIESTRAITPTAHYGAAWIQADVAGSGLVWLRAADSPMLPIVGPDLAPPPTRTPAPRPTAEPQPPCASAGVDGKRVEVCGWGDLAAEAQAKWLETYGGNIGTVTTPTPQEWNRP